MLFDQHSCELAANSDTVPSFISSICISLISLPTRSNSHLVVVTRQAGRHQCVGLSASVRQERSSSQVVMGGIPVSRTRVSPILKSYGKGSGRAFLSSLPVQS